MASDTASHAQEPYIYLARLIQGLPSLGGATAVFAWRPSRSCLWVRDESMWVLNEKSAIKAKSAVSV